jgi:hypothetical protein
MSLAMGVSITTLSVVERGLVTRPDIARRINEYLDEV